MRKFLIVNSKDNVATALKDLSKGTVMEIEERGKSITLLDDIPKGHKFAIERILPQKEIIKYGEVIGICETEIKEGEHVHVHNMSSQRGRGDIRNFEATSENFVFTNSFPD